ncbi:MAG: helix-turn-helix domain-containing protein [Bacteroidota bacterium]
MMYQIQSEEEYNQVMEKVDSYLQTATQMGGFHMLSAAQRADLQSLSKLAESWEDDIPLMPIAQPQTLVGMIELKMYERKLKQKDLAVLLEISPTRLSEVLQAKRKVNMDLAKRLYKVLKIDPAFILETA